MKKQKRCLQKYLGDAFRRHPMFGMAEGMTIEMLATMAEDMFTDKVLYVLNKELTKIKKVIVKEDPKGKVPSDRAPFPFGEPLYYYIYLVFPSLKLI